MTGDLFQLNTLCIAIAAGMFKLADTGFDTLKLYAVLKLGALLLRMNSDGFSLDTVKANKVLSAGSAALAYIAFVE